MENYQFYAFRYFLVANDQVSIYHNMIKDKREIIENIFKDLEKQNKISKILGDRRFILCLSYKISKDIYVCKFAKEKHFTKFEESEYDIKDIDDCDYPFVFLIVDVRNQIILIQHKSNVFRHISTAKNKLQEWIMFNTEMYDYNFKLDEITHEHIFWDYVKSAENIFEVNLKMKSPNLFDGWIDANEVLAILRGIFNNTETNIKLSNEKGKLKIEKKSLDSIIKYITDCGGEWRLKAKLNGVIRSLRSKECIKIVQIPEISDDNFDGIKKVIMEKLNEVEDILGGRGDEKS